MTEEILSSSRLPTPNNFEIAVQDRTLARRPGTLEASTATRGLPSRFPRLLASANPERTRSRISSRSNSAIEAKIPNTSRPLGVEVSTPSCRLTNSIPRATTNALGWKGL